MPKMVRGASLSSEFYYECAIPLFLVGVDLAGR